MRSYPFRKRHQGARSEARTGAPAGAEEGHSAPNPKESGIARSDIRVPEAKRGRVPL